MSNDSILQTVETAINTTAEVQGVFPKGLEIKSFSQVKYVQKPWGFELWLSNATDMPFALKIIHIKAGNKTSLQYHEKKIECNCLIEGTAIVHYKNEESGEITTTKLEAGNIIRVWPPTIHRVEAVTDIVLVEASTSELDDVIRLSDDYARPDGKIESEHTVSDNHA